MTRDGSYGWEASVKALAVSGAAVYAGGNFIMAGDKAASNFARWGTAPNVAVNPGFEQADTTGGANGWTMDAAATRSTAYKRTGGYALKQSSTSNAVSIVSQQINNLKGGVTYTASAWVAVPATTDKFQWYVEVQWRNGTTNIGTPVIINRQIVPTNNSWVQLVGTVVAPGGTTNAILRLRANDLAATVYVDDVVFTAETAPPATAASVQGERPALTLSAPAVMEQPRQRSRLSSANESNQPAPASATTPVGAIQAFATRATKRARRTQALAAGAVRTRAAYTSAAPGAAPARAIQAFAAGTGAVNPGANELPRSEGELTAARRAGVLPLLRGRMCAANPSEVPRTSRVNASIHIKEPGE